MFNRPTDLTSPLFEGFYEGSHEPGQLPQLRGLDVLACVPSRASSLEPDVESETRP